ncbi:MAG: GIY-YIG nuclease family protein [Hassallia sp. WJT32-NPBG1]|jgi:hypothetical protein|nr:GIY-YIG nuclease family protein [Hassallia sp. WJT32-NPBG1]
MPYQQRDDNVQGYIYLLKAKGFHGWIPGAVLGRYKIGLSRDVDRRLDTLHGNQPPTDLEVVKVIVVEDMASVEAELHRVFKSQNVKLLKSREYFDLNPLQVQYCLWLMRRYEARRWSSSEIPLKPIAASLIALLGVGILIGQSFQPEPTNQTIIEKSVKSNYRDTRPF